MAAQRVKELQPCGTIAAYWRHRQAGEAADELCLKARREYQRKLRAESGSRLVPAVGTIRRLEALIAIGWTNEALAAEMGLATKASIAKLLRARKVSRQTVEVVALLFDRLQCTPAQIKGRSQVERELIPPPLAWDQGALDNPSAKPAEWRRPAHALNRAEDIARDAAELMGSFGESPEGAASRLGITLGSMQTAIRRAALRAERSESA